MAFGAVAGDHDQRVGNHIVQNFLRICENQHPARRTGIVQLVEALLAELFTRVGQYQIAVANAQPLFPSRIKQC